MMFHRVGFCCSRVLAASLAKIDAEARVLANIIVRSICVIGYCSSIGNMGHNIGNV